LGSGGDEQAAGQSGLSSVRRPKYPQTLHYTGDGIFMVSGKIISRRSQFRPGML
jgi:hypothetical protein